MNHGSLVLERSGTKSEFRCLIEGEEIFLDTRIANEIFSRHENDGIKKVTSFPISILKSQLFLHGYTWKIVNNKEVIYCSSPSETEALEI